MSENNLSKYNTHNQTATLSERYVSVEFYDDNKQSEKFEGIDIMFTVTKKRCALRNSASFQIANLKRERIEYLTSFASQWVNMEKHRRIRIKAGYVDKDVKDKGLNAGIIYDGDLLSAIPTQPPDVWLECEGLSGMYDNQKIGALSIKGKVKVSEIAKTIANKLKLKFINELTAKNDKTVDGFYHSGGMSDLTDEINNLGIATVFIDDDTLHIQDNDPKIPTNTDTVPVVSMETGLIGIPRPDPLGVRFTVQLTSKYKLGEALKLESKAIPSCNGIYYPYIITYRGSLRGAQFVTELDCRRFWTK